MRSVIATPRTSQDEWHGSAPEVVRRFAVKAVLLAETPPPSAACTELALRLGALQREWLTVAAELGLSSSFVHTWIMVDAVLDWLIEAYDERYGTDSFVPIAGPGPSDTTRS